MSISVSKQSLRIAKRDLSDFDGNSVISFRIEILRHFSDLSNFVENTVISILIVMFRRLRALFTPFDTPYVVHVDFSVETIPANRKTRSFKFRRKFCHFVPDRDTTAFKRSFKFRRKHCYLDPDCDVSTFKGPFHSIRHAVCSACRFQCRNNPCKSQNAIFQISMKTLSLRS
jgi:hypothetical protein